jgi:hypothetical protein
MQKPIPVLRQSNFSLITYYLSKFANSTVQFTTQLECHLVIVTSFVFGLCLGDAKL